jgi:hypothetical protein
VAVSFGTVSAACHNKAKRATLAGIRLVSESAPGLPFPDARAVETNTDDMPIEPQAQVANLAMSSRAAGVIGGRRGGRAHIFINSAVPSETAHFALGLRPSQSGQSVTGDGRAAEHAAELPSL